MFFLEAMFEYLKELFNRGGSVDVEDVNFEMKKYWDRFLKANFDATEVAKMMSTEDVLAHYNELIACGAEIDMTDIVSKFDEDFIREHCEQFVDAGVSADEILAKCEVRNIDDIKFFLGLNFEAEDIFYYGIEYFDGISDDPRETLKNLFLLYGNGLSTDSIKSWIDAFKKRSLIDDIVENKDWRKMGIDSSDYLKLWAENNSDYIDDLGKLPKTVNPLQFVECLSMKDILRSSRYGFHDFVDDYLEIGGDIDTLAKRFVDEIGYSSENAEDMLDLIEAGATVTGAKKVIDMDKFVDSLIDNRGSGNFAPWFLDDTVDILRRRGVSESLIAKILS